MNHNFFNQSTKQFTDLIKTVELVNKGIIICTFDSKKTLEFIIKELQHELISQKIYTHEISYIAKDEFQINDKIDQTKINTIQNFMKTQKTVISVTKTEEIFNEKKIKRLNSQRQLFNSIPYPVVFWLNESFMTSFSEFATDFMSDNTAFFEFTEKDLWVQSKIPLGSPYGFNNSDWNYVSKRSSLNHTLVVTIGYQFKSSFYDSKNLIKNIKSMFRKSIKKYNQETGSVIKLKFITLGAGYGEHLFNAIARDIISADIAVFDTSDQNPNVMLEMGVALTWGISVLPIRKTSCPPPPSDISGQTWDNIQQQWFGFRDR